MKSKITFIALVLTTLMNLALVAQEKKNAPTSLELFKEIEHADSTMFDAFNRQDMVTFKAMFTKDLEWFQDNGGLIFYRTAFQNFETNFRNENKLSRKLVKGSMEVHPIKGYGAIQIGSHQFSHIENGKE